MEDSASIKPTESHSSYQPSGLQQGSSWSPKRTFLSLSRPRWSGWIVGLVSGLLVVALAAGLALLYLVVSNIGISSAYGYPANYTDSFGIFLFGAFAIIVLLLVGLGLPLLFTLSKGRRAIVTAFAFELIVVAIALATVVSVVVHRPLPRDDYMGNPGFYDYRMCPGGACEYPL